MLERRSFGSVRLYGVLFAVLCTGLLGGCAALSGYPADPQKPDTLGALRDKYFSPTVEDCYKAGDCTDALKLTGRQAIRDDVVLSRMHIYDMEFTLFVRDLSGGNNTFSIGTDLTALALNGLGATTGNAGTKAALAAASGGVIASNGAINKDLFYQKTVPAIIAQMEADRQKAEATILNGLSHPDVVYPLQRANLDLDILNDAGSLNSAVAKITQQSSNEKTKTQDQMNRFSTSAMARTASAVKIRAWLFPSGGLDPTHYGQMLKWLTENTDQSLHAVTVEQIADVTDDSLETARQRAIADPQLAIK